MCPGGCLVSPHGEPFAWCPKCHKHNCKFQGKLGELVYICSRCRRCYICQHRYVEFGDGEIHLKCKDGKFRPTINDGRLQGPPIVKQRPCLCGNTNCPVD